jgi:opacity protein-like surface antigen
MKKTTTLVALLVVCSFNALGQTETPKADIFAGYAYGRIDANIDYIGAQGFGLSVTGNVNRVFGLTGEYSYGRGDLDSFLGGAGVNTRINTHLALFGPRLHARSEKATGFVHALFGVANAGVGASVLGSNISIGDTNFAMGYGGGVDINVSKNFAIRLAQVDYIPVRVEGEWANNFRFMAGVVFRFGN